MESKAAVLYQHPQEYARRSVSLSSCAGVPIGGGNNSSRGGLRKNRVRRLCTRNSRGGDRNDGGAGAGGIPAADTTIYIYI